MTTLRTTTLPAVSTGSDSRTVSTVMASKVWPIISVNGHNYTIVFKQRKTTKDLISPIVADAIAPLHTRKHVLNNVSGSATVASLIASITAAL